MKKLSIIIVTYNSQKDILNCLNSVFEFSDIERNSLEIIVIDNSSTETFLETSALITSLYGTEIKIVHNSSNGGYGQGNNLGISIAESSLVCVMNPDVVLVKPIFNRIMDTFESKKKLAMLGGKQWGGQNISFWIRPEFDFYFFTGPLSKLLNKLNIYLGNFFYLSGALLFIDKEKFHEIGGFDEDFFMYCEEADLTNRFLKKGYTTEFDKILEYRHLIDDRNRASENHLKFLFNSWKVYFVKFGFNFESFLYRRLWSHQIMMMLGKVSGQEMYQKNKYYLTIFKNLIKNSKS